MILAAALLLVFLLLPSQVSAGPVIGSLFAGAFWSTAVGNALLQIGTGLVLSAISNAIYRQQAGKTPGLRSDTATVGETTPQTVMVGYYGTNGNLAAPFMSHNKVVFEEDPVLSASDVGHGVFRTHIYDISDHPVHDLPEIIINGKVFALSDMVTGTRKGKDMSPYGVTPASGDYQNKFYVKWYDGTQTVADPMLVAAYTNHSERPWSSAAVGKGVAYAIVTFVRDDKLWQGEPRVRFTVKGAPLYDPRTASTVYTENPIVIAWNLMRGITMPDGQVYGLGVDLNALPSDWWHDAMDACDVDRGDGNATFRCGYEIKIANPSLGGDVPLDVLGVLADTCAAEFCDMGGKWLVRVGSVALPVATITDADLMRTRGHSFDPFPAIDEIVNAVHASYPSSENGWETREAPPLYNATYEAEDGGQRYIASISLPAVWDDEQVQFLMHSGLKDARKHRQHVEALPPEYAYMTPLDAITRTSVVHGYLSKVFEIGKMTLDTATGAVIVQHRERDPLDYDTGDFVPTNLRIPSNSVITPVPITVSGFTVTADAVTDGAGTDRRPRLTLSWDSDGIEGATGLTWVVRVKTTGAEVARGSYERLSDERLEVTEGILPGVEYEAQAEPVASVPTVATAWLSATAPSVLIDTVDVATNAVTRRSFFKTTGSVIFNPSVQNDVPITDPVAMSLSPYELTGGVPDNPLTATVTGAVQRYDAGPFLGEDLFVLLLIQARDTSVGTWDTLSSTSQVLRMPPIDDSFINFSVSLIGSQDVPGIEDYDEFRVIVRNVVSNGWPETQFSNVQVVFQQLSR